MAAFKRGLLIGLAVGYVQGAKAGRERYEQINRTWRRIKTTPSYQRLSEKASALAGLGIQRGKIVALDGIEKASGRVKDKLVRNGNGAGRSQHPSRDF